MEGLEGVGFFAGAEEFYGLSGDGLDGQNSAAAGIPFDLRQDDAGHSYFAIELLGHLHRILTDHGVGDEQNLMRRCAGLDRDQFLHQVVINMQTSAGVQNDHVVTLGTCLIDAMFAGAHGIG